MWEEERHSQTPENPGWRRLAASVLSLYCLKEKILARSKMARQRAFPTKGKEESQRGSRRAPNLALLLATTRSEQERLVAEARKLASEQAGGSSPTSQASKARKKTSKQARQASKSQGSQQEANTTRRLSLRSTRSNKRASLARELQARKVRYDSGTCTIF